LSHKISIFAAQKQSRLKLLHIDINEYNYPLEEERVAKYPLEERDTSNLLVAHPDMEIYHKKFNEISTELPAGSLVLYNNTKVIHARVEFRKETGARIEIFCLSPVSPVDYQLMFSTIGKCTWSCMVGNLKKWKSGKLTRVLTVNDLEVVLTAEISERDEKGNPIILFEWNGNFTFSEVLESAGIIPIPPYLNRETEELDASRYQTVYSRHNGSVAAPTAGLHFTEKVFNDCRKNNIDFAEVTLHVGAGTFQPVKADNAMDHPMHGEQFIVSKQLLLQLLSHSHKIIATGTTTMRTLESIYWLGIKAMKGLDLDRLEQWFWKDNDTETTLEESLEVLLKHLSTINREFLVATTEIMIVPGYRFRVVDGIITNFHQPKSTLLLLISAFIGERWKEVYKYALNNDFRFLSYGDSSILWRQSK
jgi:S-adenosylmethionine:tRNA ribosyltransferase-isomerase